MAGNVLSVQSSVTYHCVGYVLSVLVDSLLMSWCNQYVDVRDVVVVLVVRLL